MATPDLTSGPRSRTNVPHAQTLVPAILLNIKFTSNEHTKVDQTLVIIIIVSVTKAKSEFYWIYGSALWQKPRNTTHHDAHKANFDGFALNAGSKNHPNPIFTPKVCVESPSAKPAQTNGNVYDENPSDLRHTSSAPQNQS